MEISTEERAENSFRLLIVRSGAGVTRNPEKKKKNQVTLFSTLNVWVGFKEMLQHSLNYAGLQA